MVDKATVINHLNQLGYVETEKGIESNPMSFSGNIANLTDPIEQHLGVSPSLEVRWMDNPYDDGEDYAGLYVQFDRNDLPVLAEAGLVFPGSEALKNQMKSEYGEFAYVLACETTAQIAGQLILSARDKRLVDDTLRPAIAVMAKHIIEPALIDDMDHNAANARTKRSHREIHDTAIKAVSAHLAKAILPDLQNPELLADKPTLTEALQDIADGLRLITPEEILPVLTSDLMDAIDPSIRVSPKAPITPRNRIPDESTRMLGMISAVKMMTATHIRLIFNPLKIKPEDYESPTSSTLSPAFANELSNILQSITGFTVAHPLFNGTMKGNSEGPDIVYRISPSLSRIAPMQEAVQKITEAVKKAQSQQSRSLS